MNVRYSVLAHSCPHRSSYRLSESYEGRWLSSVVALIAIAAISVGNTAHAILLTHNNSTVLVAEDFETVAVGQPWDNGAQPGNWESSESPLTNLVADASPPGAFEGQHYGTLDRTASQQGIRSKFTPIDSGRVDLDTMVYIPDGMQWLSIALGNSVGYNPTSPSPFIHSYVIFHLNSTGEVHDYAIDEVPMNFLYKNGEWMRLKIGYDFANPGSGYTVDLTTTDGTFNYTRGIINAETPIDTLLIKFEANGNSAYFDASAPIPPAGVLGDFNNDGSVDAADYVMWRKLDTTNEQLPNDNGLGIPIGSEHYDLWSEHFGETLPGGGLGGTAVVPEPTALLSSTLGLLTLAAGRRRRATRPFAHLDQRRRRA